MSIIKKKITLEGSLGKDEIEAIFDSGAAYSFIKAEIAKNLEIITPLPSPMEFETAKKGEKMVAKEATRLNFYIDGYRFSDEFLLLENLSIPVVIGATTLQKWRMKLDFEKDDVIINPEVTKLWFL